MIEFSVELRIANYHLNIHEMLAFLIPTIFEKSCFGGRLIDGERERMWKMIEFSVELRIVIDDSAMESEIGRG